MGLFGRGKEKKKAEEKEKARVFQSEQLTDYRQKKDWTGWKVVPRPDLKDPVTGKPIVFPPPPESWKEYGWAVFSGGPNYRFAMDPATGKYILIVGDGVYGYIRFCEPDGTLRGEYRWMFKDDSRSTWEWTKPKDIKERAKVVEDFLVKGHMAHAACRYLFPHCAGPLVRGAGLPKGSISHYRMGTVDIDDEEGIHFFDPPELWFKKK
jgi:hypothetical protein